MSQRGPQDGYLHVVGMDGCQTAAVVDGGLQRVRSTGQPMRIPLELQVEPEDNTIHTTGPDGSSLVAE